MWGVMIWGMDDDHPTFQLCVIHHLAFIAGDMTGIVRRTVNTNSLNQITCMFIINQRYSYTLNHCRVMEIKDILESIPTKGCFHFLVKTSMRNELQLHKHRGTVVCSHFFLANQTTQSVQRSKKKSPQGLKYF